MSETSEILDILNDLSKRMEKRMLERMREKTIEDLSDAVIKMGKSYEEAASQAAKAFNNGFKNSLSESYFGFHATGIVLCPHCRKRTQIDTSRSLQAWFRMKCTKCHKFIDVFPRPDGKFDVYK